MGKPLVVIFEGVDKSGKTTLRDAFNKATDFKYVVLDRFTTSSKVYAKLFGRRYSAYYDDVENTLLKNYNAVIIYCDCKNDMIRFRLKAANEVLPSELRNISKVKEMFIEELYKISDRCTLVFIDTMNDKDSCVYEIIDAIHKVEMSQC